MDDQNSDSMVSNYCHTSDQMTKDVNINTLQLNTLYEGLIMSKELIKLAITIIKSFFASDTEMQKKINISST